MEKVVLCNTCTLKFWFATWHQLVGNLAHVVKEEQLSKEIGLSFIFAFTGWLLSQVSLHRQSLLSLQQLNGICFISNFAFHRHTRSAYHCFIRVSLHKAKFILIISRQTLKSWGTEPCKVSSWSCDMTGGINIQDNKPPALIHQQHPLKDVHIYTHHDRNRMYWQVWL